MSFVSFGTHIFGEKTLHFPIYLFNVIINGWYSSSRGFKSIRVGLTMHGSSFKNRYFITKDSLKPNIIIQ